MSGAPIFTSFGAFATPATTTNPIGWVILGGYAAYKMVKYFTRKKPSPSYDYLTLDNTSLQDIPVPVCYGNVTVAGNIIYDSLSRDELAEKTRNIIIALSEGEILGISSIVQNGVGSPENVSSLPATSPDSAIYTFFSGEDPGTGSPLIWNGVLGPIMDDGGVVIGVATDNEPYASDKLRAMHIGSLIYLAYVGITLRGSTNYDLNATPTIITNIWGRKVSYWDGANWQTDYDLIADPNNKILALRNPAHILLDFLTNTRYGAGISSDYMDLPSFATASEYYSEAVASGNQRYLLDYVIDSKMRVNDIRDEMLSACDSFLVWSAEGKFRLKVGRPDETIVKYFDGDNITPDTFVFEKLDSNDVANKIIVEYIDYTKPNNKGIVTAMDDEDMDARGIKEEVIPLRGVTDSEQAQRLAHLFLLKEKREDTACRFGSGEDATECEAGDVIAVTDDVSGWVNKLFRIVTTEEDEEGEMFFTCSEYCPDIYNDAISSSDPEVHYSTLPDPRAKPITPTGFTIITNNSDLSVYSTAMQTSIKQEIKNLQSLGINAYVILVDFVGVGSDTSRIDSANIMPYDCNGQIDQLQGIGTSNGGNQLASTGDDYTDLYNLMEGKASPNGQYLVVFDDTPDTTGSEGLECKIIDFIHVLGSYYIFILDTTELGILGTKHKFFIVSKNDIENIK